MHRGTRTFFATLVFFLIIGCFTRQSFGLQRFPSKGLVKVPKKIGFQQHFAPSFYSKPSRLAMTGYKGEDPLTLRQEILRILPFASFILSSMGVCFQVFVLYPWHEELSAEFKDLEVAIVKLDTTLNNVDPKLDPIELTRVTDKYVQGIQAYTAGPRISKMMPSQLWDAVK